MPPAHRPPLSRRLPALAEDLAGLAALAILLFAALHLPAPA